MNKNISRTICIILCILLITIPVYGININIGDVVPVSQIRFTHLENNVNHTLNGNVKFIDNDTFLNYVTLFYSYNQDFQDKFTTIPYSIQRAIFYDGTNAYTTLVPTMLYGNSSLTPKVTGWYMLNGRPYELTSGTAINWSSDNMPFDTVYQITGVDPPGQAGPYNYCIGADSNGYILAYYPGQDNSAELILDSLASITENIYEMALDTGSSNAILTSIYSAIGTSNNTLSSIAQSLSSISTSISSVLQNQQSIINSLGVTNQTISTVNNNIVSGFSTVDTDLNSIDTQFTAFRTSFNSYTISVLQELSIINSNVEHIDSTLDEMMDHFNGTALEEIPVSGGGGATNLWNLIKNTVTIGIDGLSEFFVMLFNSIGYFASSATNGFAYINNISSYNPVAYNPTDLTMGHNLYTFTNTFRVTSNGWNIYSDGDKYHYGSISTGSVTYTQFLWPSMVLSPGTYILKGSGSPNVDVILYNPDNQRQIAGTNINDFQFTLNTSTNVAIKVFNRKTTAPYDGEFVPGIYER